MAGRKIGFAGSGDRRSVLKGLVLALPAAATAFAYCAASFAQPADVSGYYRIVDAASRDKTDDVIAMLQAGRSPNDTDDSGETALGYAAQFGDARMAKALLHYGAAVDARDQFGNTALHWAAQRGNVQVIRLLLGAHAAVDVRNKQGMTPLMMAAQNGKVPAVRMLLAHGADPRKEDFTGRDAFGWAQGKPGVVEALRDAKAG